MTNTIATKVAIPEAIAIQAVEWQIAHQAGDADATQFQHWLNAHELHQQAWAHIQSANNRLQLLIDPAARSALLTPRGRQRRKLARDIALLLFVGTTGLSLHRAKPWESVLADVTTGTGERLRFDLQDGSRLDLNSATAVNIQLQDNKLRVQLVRGELLLTTRKSLGKPQLANLPTLSVITANGEFLPLGTRFSVRLHDSHSELAVFEGDVAVQQHTGNRLGIIKAGESCGLSNKGIVNTKAADETSTAWSDGMLVATSMPLGQFVQELARHRKGFLECDPAIADLRVSGTYPLADIDKVLSVLQQSFPVRVERITSWWVRLVPA